MSTGVEIAPRATRTRPDLILVFAVGALSMLGLLMLYTITAPKLEAAGLSRTTNVTRQAVFAAVGFAAFLGMSFISDRTWRLLTPIVYGGSLALLIMVLSPLGSSRQGAQRWIDLGPIDIQPSEFAKLAVILALGLLLATVEENRMKWLRIAKTFAIVSVPSAFIFLQPDLGTMLAFGFVAVVMLFAAGTTVRQLGLLLLIAVVALLIAFELDILKEYQLDRITGFLNAGEQTLDINYNQNQSQIAIGNGGLFGAGLFEGTQTNLAFVPAQTTDFVFTAVGEQLGFAGGVLTLGLFLLIIWRLLIIGASARDGFGRMVATGTAALIGFHVFVNVGMVVGLLPVTGLPLPFMSEGGSFYLAMSAAMGISHAIWLRRSRVPGERHLL
ncbi:rod shape-determining protein RodA [bacterium]|nr:rod shape-determining protein RodA [bacterium]